MEGKAFQLTESRDKIGLTLAGLAAVAFACWIALSYAGEPVISIAGAGLVFCAICSPFWIAVAFRPATLRVGPQGIHLSSAFQDVEVAWSNIEVIERRFIWPGDNSRVMMTFARPQRVRRLLGWDGVVELSFGMTWPLSPDELTARLVEARNSFAAQAPSRPADSVAM